MMYHQRNGCLLPLMLLLFATGTVVPANAQSCSSPSALTPPAVPIATGSGTGCSLTNSGLVADSSGTLSTFGTVSAGAMNLTLPALMGAPQNGYGVVSVTIANSTVSGGPLLGIWPAGTLRLQEPQRSAILPQRQRSSAWLRRTPTSCCLAPPSRIRKSCVWDLWPIAAMRRIL